MQMLSLPLHLPQPVPRCPFCLANQSTLCVYLNSGYFAPPPPSLPPSAPPPLSQSLSRLVRTVRQFKSRMIEAAACGAVMLVFNDGYNVIEQYFEPGVDFVYWTDLDDFHVKVRTVLADPATYEAMARRARDKALRQYNTDTFVQDYIVPFLKARDGR